MKKLLLFIAIGLMLSGCVVYPGYYDGYYGYGYYGGPYGVYPYGYVAPNVDFYFYGGHGFHGGHGGHHGGWRR